MSSHRKLSSIILLVILTMSMCLLSEYPVAAQTDQIALKIQAANSAVEQAFNGVLDAEKAGTNVTNLIKELNAATNLLAEAENAYRINDMSTALNDANAVIPIAQQVKVDAQKATETALAQTQNDIWHNILLLIVGVLIFILILFLFWRWFKRRYIKTLYHAKPEVKTNEAE